MQQGQERRRYPRAAKAIPLKISCDGFDVVTETENLSGAGAYCRVDRYIQPMTKLQMVILLPVKQRNKTVNKKVECSGVVVRTENIQDKEDWFKIAIFFNDISKKSVQNISDYVNQHLKQESVVS